MHSSCNILEDFLPVSCRFLTVNTILGERKILRFFRHSKLNKTQTRLQMETLSNVSINYNKKFDRILSGKIKVKENYWNLRVSLKLTKSRQKIIRKCCEIKVNTIICNMHFMLWQEPRGRKGDSIWSNTFRASFGASSNTPRNSKRPHVG